MWLAAFEAVARRGSVTAAAAELSLTQGAVSRQVQKLEDQIGTALFERSKQRLHLTPAGQSYAEDIRQGMNLIANAGIKLHANPKGGVLDLAVLPAFATHWLAPRLLDFMSQCPGVSVNLSTRTRPFDFSTETFHAAIHFGTSDWPGAHAVFLMDEEVVAVASPDIVARAASDGVEAILTMPLLHLETRSDAWSRWFDQRGVSATDLAGIKFDQFAAMIQAAVFGLGAAIVPKYLVEAELETGSLVGLRSAAPSVIGAYYLVWPEQSAQYQPVIAFRDWIKSAVPDPAII